MRRESRRQTSFYIPSDYNFQAVVGKYLVLLVVFLTAARVPVSKIFAQFGGCVLDDILWLSAGIFIMGVAS